MGTYQNGQFEDVTATILREREDFLDLRWSWRGGASLQASTCTVNLILIFYSN